MTQVGYLGSQLGKYVFLAIKFLLGKLFDPNNIKKPVQYASKVVFGSKRPHVIISN